MKRRTYTVQEAAQILGLPASTLYEHVRNGKVDDLKPIRYGHRIVFPRGPIDRLTGAA